MSIDRTTIPPGTIVDCEGSPGHWKFAHDFQDCWKVTRAYVPVPDGMTVEDARDALNDARPWVPVSFWHEVPKGARYRNVGGVRGGDGVDGIDGRYEVHPEDADPVDPDADLIERIARALALGSESKAFDALTATLRQQFRDDAKIALAVVREAGQS